MTDLLLSGEFKEVHEKIKAFAEKYFKAEGTSHPNLH
jgi:hypothetical protein